MINKEDKKGKKKKKKNNLWSINAFKCRGSRRVSGEQWVNPGETKAPTGDCVVIERGNESEAMSYLRTQRGSTEMARSPWL